MTKAGKAVSKGMRPKHVPQRMCIVCRSRFEKRQLVRLVRTEIETVVIDPGGKRNGRGAYLCDQAACWHAAFTTGILERALKTTIDESARRILLLSGLERVSEPSTENVPSSQEIA